LQIDEIKEKEKQRPFENAGIEIISPKNTSPVKIISSNEKKKNWTELPIEIPASARDSKLNTKAPGYDSPVNAWVGNE